MLESMAMKYTLSYCDVIRAKIILLADEGLSNDVIATGSMPARSPVCTILAMAARTQTAVPLFLRPALRPRESDGPRRPGRAPAARSTGSPKPWETSTVRLRTTAPT